MNNIFRTPIIFVGGKGGVGKTTLSAAIASKLAAMDKKTLIVSTDPAHSLGDALAVPLQSESIEVSPCLFAQELDIEKVTDRHFAQIEETLRGYAKPEMFGKIKEHLELSKQSPGASEAAILESICEIITNTSDYEHIIFDTAPTGHTMRLLSLPNLMTVWTEGLMSRQRNRQKAKEAAEVFWKDKADDKHNPFNDQSQDRWQRAIQQLDKRKQLFKNAGEVLTNSKLCEIFLVMIPQALPFEETQRALNQLQQFNIRCGGVLINQVIPPFQQDSLWQAQEEKQQRILAMVEKKFIKQKLYYIPLSDADLRGVNQLQSLSFTV